MNINESDALLSVIQTLSITGKVNNATDCEPCEPCEDCGALVQLKDNNPNASYEYWDQIGSGGNPPSNPPATGGVVASSSPWSNVRLQAKCGGNAVPYYLYKNAGGTYTYVGFIAMSCSEGC